MQLARWRRLLRWLVVAAIIVGAFLWLRRLKPNTFNFTIGKGGPVRQTTTNDGWDVTSGVTPSQSQVSADGKMYAGFNSDWKLIVGPLGQPNNSWPVPVDQDESIVRFTFNQAGTKLIAITSPATEIATTRVAIVNLGTKKISYLPATVKSAAWLDNDRFVYLYPSSNTLSVASRADLSDWRPIVSLAAPADWQITANAAGSLAVYSPDESEDALKTDRSYLIDLRGNAVRAVEPGSLRTCFSAKGTALIQTDPTGKWQSVNASGQKSEIGNNDVGLCVNSFGTYKGRVVSAVVNNDDPTELITLTYNDQGVPDQRVAVPTSFGAIYSLHPTAQRLIAATDQGWAVISWDKLLAHATLK